MLRHIPNILTMGRLVLTVVFLIMILMAPKYYADGERPFPGFLDVAFILFVVAGLTDIADGIAARRLNVTSKFGRMVDPLADMRGFHVLCTDRRAEAVHTWARLAGSHPLGDTGHTGSQRNLRHGPASHRRGARRQLCRHHLRQDQDVPSIFRYRHGYHTDGSCSERYLGILVHVGRLCLDADRDGNLGNKGDPATARP